MPHAQSLPWAFLFTVTLDGKVLRGSRYRFLLNFSVIARILSAMWSFAYCVYSVHANGQNVEGSLDSVGIQRIETEATQNLDGVAYKPAISSNAAVRASPASFVLTILICPAMMSVNSDRAF
jgi:hypothetical protein